MREWLLLDSGKREDLLIRYEDIFDPLNESAFSGATRYSDLVAVTKSLANGSQVTDEATSHLGIIAPNLLKALKSLAVMVIHDSKA